MAIALYNHALNLLTYIDSEAANVDDDDEMPLWAAKKANVLRKTESYLQESAMASDIEFEGSREMFGWKCVDDGWCGYERMRCFWFAFAKMCLC